MLNPKPLVQESLPVAEEMQMEPPVQGPMPVAKEMQLEENPHNPPAQGSSANSTESEITPKQLLDSEEGEADESAPLQLEIGFGTGANVPKQVQMLFGPNQEIQHQPQIEQPQVLGQIDPLMGHKTFKIRIQPRKNISCWWAFRKTKATSKPRKRWARKKPKLRFKVMTM